MRGNAVRGSACATPGQRVPGDTVRPRRPRLPHRAIALIPAAGLLTGCSGEQEDGSTLRADPDLPFASFQRPADGSTLRHRGHVMAPDWELHGTVTLRNGCVGLGYTNEERDQEFATLGVPLPATWDAGTQTVSGTGYEFVVGDTLDLSGQLIDDEAALPSACRGGTRRILVSNDSWIRSAG